MTEWLMVPTGSVVWEGSTSLRVRRRRRSFSTLGGKIWRTVHLGSHCCGWLVMQDMQTSAIVVWLGYLLGSEKQVAESGSQGLIEGRSSDD
jgi:hypothetical protein